MFDWLKRLFAASGTLPDHSAAPQWAKDAYEKDIGYAPSIAISTSTQRANAASLARAMDEVAFWASVRAAAEKKIGGKLPDKVWNEEAVREKWRQRLNMVKP